MQKLFKRSILVWNCENDLKTLGNTTNHCFIIPSLLKRSGGGEKGERKERKVVCELGNRLAKKVSTSVSLNNEC